jgi:tetratricopeptide (TPR) repeat protein
VKSLVLVSLVLTIVARGDAQSLDVVYVEGHAQVQKGNSWIDLYLGDSLSIESSLRLQSAAIVQLQNQQASVFLNRPGTYVLVDVLKDRSNFSSSRIASVVVNCLRVLAFGRVNRASTVSGPRAVDASEAENAGWVESSSQVFLEGARAHIAHGDYDHAIKQLNQALEFARKEEVPSIRFQISRANALSGNVQVAWMQLEQLRPVPADDWVPDFVLLKAKLLLDSSAYAEEVAWLIANDLSQDSWRAALYYFLLGVGQRAAGDIDGSNNSLDKVKTISADSDLGMLAVELRSGP